MIKSHEEYVEALKSHDWSFDMTEDHQVWIWGHNQLANLTRWQRIHDPDHVIWNQHCPKAYRIPHQPKESPDATSR